MRNLFKEMIGESIRSCCWPEKKEKLLKKRSKTELFIKLSITNREARNKMKKDVKGYSMDLPILDF
jgi:hypothetical protein